MVDAAEKTSVTIPNLEADEEYCVRMKSVSFTGDSGFTAPLKRRVFRTGTNACICVISNDQDDHNWQLVVLLICHFLL